MRSNQRGLSLIEVLVVIGIIAILVAILFPAIQRVRESARRADCASRLRQFGLAMHSYHAQHDCFPPAAAGQGASHFVWMLPYLEMNALYQSANFDCRFDFDPRAPGGRANETVKATRVSLFLCPSDLDSDRSISASAGRSSWPVPHFTNYAGVHNAWPGTSNGVFASVALFHNVVRDKDVSSLSSTVAMSEWLKGVVPELPGSRLRAGWYLGVPWDRMPEACDQLNVYQAQVSMIDKGRPWAHAGFGQTLYDHVLPPNHLSCMFSYPYYSVSASSAHSGGVNALSADGHVTFIAETIDMPIWQRIGDRKSSDSVTRP